MTKPMVAPMPTTASSPVPLTSARIMASIRSHLDLDDLLHPYEACDHEAETNEQHDLAGGLGPQWLHVLRVDEVHSEGQRRRHDREHVGAHAAFCRQRLDVTAQPLALGHRLRNGHQQFGQVAADLALDPDG